MEIFSLFMLWLHVIAAVTWIGGNLILAMVIVPHFRQNLPPCPTHSTTNTDRQTF